MMKNYLLELKKILMGASIVAGIGLITGCGADTVSEENEPSFIVNDDDLENDKTKNIERHEHVIVEMGKTTYIIRECDDSISDIRVVEHDGFISLDVYNADEDQVINSYIYGPSEVYVIDNDSEEETVNDIEDRAITNGAIVYKALKR